MLIRYDISVNWPSLNGHIGLMYPWCLLFHFLALPGQCGHEKWRTCKKNLWAGGCHFIWSITLSWTERKKIACSYNEDWIWVLLLFSCKFSQLPWHAIHIHLQVSCILMQICSVELATTQAPKSLLSLYISFVLFFNQSVVANWAQLKCTGIISLFSHKS